MIGTLDIKVAAHNPNFPLEPVFTFINSAQSFRIRNVPRAIGKWNITKVFIHLNYPDNTTIQKECVLNGNIWIGTVEGCATSGTSTNGFYVTASGIDENENAITNYVLGAGDLYVKDLDGTIDPERTGQKMYFNDTLPTNPKKGDATFIDQTLNVYDGTNWVPVATDPDLSNYYTKAQVDEAFRNKTDLNVYEEVICPWIVTNGVGAQSTYNWNDETQLWEYGAARIGFVDGVWQYGVKVGKIIRWIGTDESPEDTLTIAFSTQTGTREAVTKKEVVGTLATESDIPTKTSDLTNDSGFITTADVPTKTSDLTNDSGFITSADIITKRDLNDLNIYVDPMADMTTTKFTVVVSYAGDPSTPLFTVELTHRGGEDTTWTWSPSGSNQRISIDYSSVTGAYDLHYYNIQDGGGNEHSGQMVLPITAPYWTGEAQDDWFHFSVTSQTTTITTKAYVDSLIAQLSARITALENNNQ